jgi:hypothetical protein
MFLGQKKERGPTITTQTANSRFVVSDKFRLATVVDVTLVAWMIVGSTRGLVWYSNTRWERRGKRGNEGNFRALLGGVC